MDNFLERISEIPLSPITKKIVEVAQNEKASVQTLAKAIMADGPFITRLLLIANASSGLSNEFTTVSQAISALGFDAIKSMALGLALYPFASPEQKDKKDKEEGTSGLRQLWEHSLSCALAAKRIALHVNHGAPYKAFIIGLLHDVGQALFYQCFREEFLKALRIAHERGISLSEAETDIFGGDHAIAGEVWARTRDFPPVIQQAIRFHHCSLLSVPEEIDPLFKKSLAIVRLGDLFCEAHHIGEGVDKGSSPEEACSLLGLTEKKCRELLGPVAQEVGARRSLFVLEEESPSGPEGSDSQLPRISAGKSRGQLVRLPTRWVHRGRAEEKVPAKKLTILVVEDHGSLCDLLSLYFMRHGYHVRTANNGETALEILTTEEVHLLILDLILPRMDGLEVLRRLREKKGHAFPYIIVVSAASGEGQKKLLELGANEFLAKPFHLSSLLGRIQAVENRFSIDHSLSKD